MKTSTPVRLAAVAFGGRAGYVKRERNPDDRRAYMISLTAAGKRAQARAEQAVDAHALQFFGRLSEAERHELHRLLARLIERPEQH